MEKKWSIINLLSVFVVVGVNYVSQALRLNNTTIGEMSDRYDNLFTPASYAFAIWGLIFISLVAYGIFQVRRAFFSKKDSSFIRKTGPWFALANVFNSMWVLAFMFDYTGLSLLIMLGILISLLMVVVKTDMELWDAPIEIIAFSWWPICLYSGWITVATIANVALYLTKLGWDGAFLTESQWTVFLIIIAVLINLFMVKTRNMREFAAVGIWALVAIYVRHREVYEEIATTALAGTSVLLAYVLYHGYKNRLTNPFKKLMQRLES